MTSTSVNNFTLRFSLLLCLAFSVAQLATAGAASVPDSSTAGEVARLGIAPSSLPEGNFIPPPPGVTPPLLISEFRLRGAHGANDEYIEIYNTSTTGHIVAATSGTGYGVAASDGVLRCTIPNGTLFAPHGHFLCTNSIAYNYGSYPAGIGTNATGDATYALDIPDNAGIALFSTNVQADFSALTEIDAVGSTSEANTLYKKGTGYPAITPFSTESAWVRDNCGKQGVIASPALCTTGGLPVNTNDNAHDFYFVDTNGVDAGGGQRLGAPGPKNSTSPIITSSIIPVLVDSTQPASSPPNRLRDLTSSPATNSTFGTLEIRRRFVNSSGGAVVQLRFRVIDITTFPAPLGTADLRPISSSDVVVSGIQDSDTCQGTTPCTITVRGTTLELGGLGQPNGGGFNSTLSTGTVTLGSPLGMGQSVDLRFLLGVQQTGAFRFIILIEALP